ncbi:MAG: GntR family transcriptional regulator [Lachnospiraceae bacterium]|nr:GntR family transcriptional regulator [Lachnospiraceae bacterium]
MSLQSTYAYNKIKEMILHMEMLPGSRIPEIQIAEKLGISRTPIHDALRRLEAEELVVIRANRGAEVKLLSMDEVKDIGAVRLAQDLLAVKLASYYGSVSDFERLEKLADECEQAAAAGNKYERIQKDMDFHIAISETGHNKRLLMQQQELYQQIHMIQITKYTDIQDSLMQIHHHKPILNAIRTGNTHEATRLTIQHIKDFYQIEPYLIRQFEQ